MYLLPRNFKVLISFLFVSACSFQTLGQATNSDSLESDSSPVSFEIDSSKITDMGVAVAPSTMRFRCAHGKTQKMYLTVTNDTYESTSFKLSFSDMSMNEVGEITQVPKAQTVKFGLTKWISAAPNYIQLMPGEQKKVEIIVTLPNEPDANYPAWGLLMVDEAKERDIIIPESSGNESVSMGVIPTYGFGVYIYQNPPNVTISKIEIQEFNFNYDDENKYVYVKVKNTGDGIGNCKAYVDLTNFNTGVSERLRVKTFNVMPGASRELNIQFPGNLEKGHYSAMMVLDFGSDEELEAAEFEFDKD